MKTKILLISLLAIFLSSQIFSQQTNNPSSSGSKGPTRLFGRVSYLMWDNSDLVDYYGGMPLLGFGLEKTWDDFTFGGSLDFGNSKVDDETFMYTQMGGHVKYAWYAFGTNRPNLYGGFGIKDIIVNDSYDGGSTHGNSFGFSFMTGVEIPFGEKTLLDLGWSSTYCRIRIEDNNVNLGNMTFHGGIIFKL